MFIWIKNNYLIFLGYSFIILFIFIFIFNTSSGNISVFNLMKINKKIDSLHHDLSNLEKEEAYLHSKIKLLNSNSLDSDYISEIAQKKLGLIKPNRVIVRLD